MMAFDILWSPDDKDCFLLVWQHDIYLLRMHLDHNGALSKHIDQNRSEFFVGKVSKFKLSVLGIWRNSVQSHCVTWFPAQNGKTDTIYDPRYLVAISTLRGDVTLLSLRDYDRFYDKFKLHKKELRISNPRCCTGVFWNSWKPNLLAQTLEKLKHPREPSILIWDVTKPANVMASVSDFRKLHLYSTQEETLPFNPVSFDDQNNTNPTGLMQVYDSNYSESGRAMATEVTTCDKPICEVGSQETTQSFAWLSNSSFIVGMSEKYLKIFDLSDTSKACQITNTKAVYGLTVDPLCNSWIASFTERQVSLWRLDSMDKPVYTFVERDNICKIKWSPNKFGWLAVLIVQSNFIKLYDTYPMFLQSLEESEQAPLEHVATPAGRSPSCILAFSWHPTLHNCLITLDHDGFVDVAQLISGASHTWSPSQTIACSRLGDWFYISRSNMLANGIPMDTTFQTETRALEFKHTGVSPQLGVPVDAETSYQHLDEILESDIAILMRKRAELGYGSCNELGSYVNITVEDKQLRNMWTWIAYMQEKVDSRTGQQKSTELDTVRLTSSSILKNGRTSPKHLGVLPILHSGEPGSSDSSRPSTDVVHDPQWEGIDVGVPFPRYRSVKRSRILRLCMWPLDDSADVQRQVFESLCADGQFERAATMALINLKFDWALSFLNRAAAAQRSILPERKKAFRDNVLSGQDIGLVTLALAGYSSGDDDLWQNTCACLLNRLDNPYLNVMFSFLSHENRSFSAILNNESMYLVDRLAFACLYLDDGQLLSYVRTACVKMVQAGRLEGVLLTGLVSVDFVMLLQHYVDRTGDVQTAAIVGLHICGLVGRDAESNRKTGTFPRSGVSVATHRRLLVEDKGYKPRLFVTAGRRTNTVAAAEIDALFLQLTGHRLALWVQTYRDLLDQWGMWFTRAEFDTAHKSRILSDYLWGSTRPSMPGSVSTDAPTPFTVAECRAGDVTPLSSIRRLSLGGNCKVRSAGLVAGTGQVFVACSYCGNRLGPQLNRATVNSTTMSNTADAANAYWDAAASNYAPMASTANFSMQGGGGKQTICQRCRQSLPRCSICLMHLGTVAASSASTAATEEQLLRRMALTILPTEKLSSAATEPIRTSILGVSPDANSTSTIKQSLLKKQEASPSRTSERLPLSMPNWFVWCQACRHGGHASHLSEWFYGTRDNGPGEVSIRVDFTDTEAGRRCPVSGCQCYCASLDLAKPSAPVAAAAASTTTTTVAFTHQTAYRLAVESGGFMPSVLDKVLATAAACAGVNEAEALLAGAGVDPQQETREASAVDKDGESQSSGAIDGENRTDGDDAAAEIGMPEDAVAFRSEEGGQLRNDDVPKGASQSDQSLSGSYPPGVSLDDIVLCNFDLLPACDRPAHL